MVVFSILEEETMEGSEGQTEKQVRSAALLEVGSSEGLYSKLLVNSKQKKKNGVSSPIVRIPRSSILDRVQSFLPQMASANEKLTKEMNASPAGNYDIENVNEDQEKIIEMDVALVELNSSDSSEEEEDSSSDESSDSDQEEVTEHNIKLSQKRTNAKIEVLQSNSHITES